MKRNYPFKELAKDDWEEGANKGLENAKELLKASTLCKDNGLHAPGSSILISASEELIKALCIKIRAATGKEPIKGFQKLFYQHQEKHHQIIVVMTILFSEQFDGLSKDESQGLLIGIGFIALILAYASSQIDESERNIFKMEDNRQAGLYLDLHKKEKRWLVPKNEINKKTFEKYHEMISVFFEKIEREYFSENSEIALNKLYSSLKELKTQVN